MTTRLFLIGGMMSMVIPIAASASLYMNTLDTLKKEFLIEDAEPIVKQFIQKIYADVNDANIIATLQNQVAKACESQNPKQYSNCTELMTRIKEILQRETLVRTVGRNLQALTSGYELPVDGMPGRALDFSSRYQGIISIWQTGTGGNIEEVGTGVLVRSKLVNEDIIGPLVNELRKAFMKIPDHERTAVVWRYQHGIRFISGARSAAFGVPPLLPFHREASPADPDNGLNTERQDLFRRWNVSDDDEPSIEQALINIWNALPQNPFDLTQFDPPLDEKEIVLFIFGNLLENIIIWARIDGNPSMGWPWGDIGLHWELPQEPALPVLIGINREPVLGGRYPPNLISQGEPVDGLGLCTHPFPAQGYLCRKRGALPGETCDESGQAPVQTNTITLMRCQQSVTATPKITELGPDICKDISWRIPNVVSNGIPPEPRPVCDPQEQVFFRNTIGNNACYTGACIEESMEYHRLISGRNSFTVQGEAYPWDPNVEPQVPRAPILHLPPITQETIPAYRPQYLIQTLDNELCQKNGLPPRTPPALCLFDIRRALSYPGKDYQPLLQRLLMQGKEQYEPTKGMERMGAGIGSRIATGLYTNYLKTTSQSLADIIGLANTLLKSIKKTEFPQEMCPFGLP